MRVLQLLLWITPGGGGTQAYLRSLLQAFAGAGDVRLLGAAVGPGQAPQGFAEPPHLGSTGRPRWRDLLAFARHVWRTARGADLVQINGIYGAQFLLGAPCCWWLGVPYIVNPLNGLAPWMLQQKAWKKNLFFDTLGGFFLRKAACVLATSQPEAEQVGLRFPRVRVQLVRVGVEVPAQPGVAWLQAAAPPQLRLLYLGSFDPWKRVPLLLQAVASLRGTGLDVRATLCGSYPESGWREAAGAIASFGLGQVVSMAGYVDGARKLELLRESHVLVLPSVTDSYSLATAEALAQGLPVVMTEGAGAAPDVQAHDCGSVVAADDVAALARAVREYADPAVLRRRALNAHRYAREVLDLPRLREGMTALYREFARSQPQA